MTNPPPEHWVRGVSTLAIDVHRATPLPLTHVHYDHQWRTLSSAQE